MKLASVFICLLAGLCGCSLCSKTTLVNPVDAYAQALAARGKNTSRLVRVIADFNNDGYDDIAVTGTGNAARRRNKWRLYLGSRRGFTDAGEIYFDPRDSYLAPLDRGVSSLIVSAYNRGRCRFVEYLLKNRELKECRTVVAPERGRDALLSSGYCNVFRRREESCSLPLYIRTRNCLWRRITN